MIIKREMPGVTIDIEMTDAEILETVNEYNRKTGLETDRKSKKSMLDQYIDFLLGNRMYNTISIVSFIVFITIVFVKYLGEGKSEFSPLSYMLFFLAFENLPIGIAYVLREVCKLYQK